MDEVIIVSKLTHYRWITRILIIFLVLSLTSCSKILGKDGNKEKSQSKQQQKKEPPRALTDMEKDTDKMIQEIQKIRDQRAQMIRQQTSMSKQEGNKTQQKPNGNSDGQQQGKQQGQQGKQQGQQQKSQSQQQNQSSIKWQEFEKNIKKLNTLWNSYEPEAKKDGASETLISKFEVQLNTLIGSVMSHDEQATLLAANELYQYYSQFLNLYKHKAPPEIKEVKYYLQQVLIRAEARQWESTLTLVENMEKSWQSAKGRMEKPDEKLNERIDYAIQDFAHAVKQKELQLTKLKGEILLKNIEKIK
jgi:ElaB/YqjD/DUF883 family membrane-anchored ribosome-binding protein